MVEGDPWEAATGYLEGRGAGRAIYASDGMNAGDFTITVRLSIETPAPNADDQATTVLPGGTFALRVAGEADAEAAKTHGDETLTWPAFVFDGNSFAFDSTHDGKFVIEGPDLGARRLLPARSRDYFKPGKVVTFQLIQKGKKIAFVMDDTVVHMVDAPVPGIKQFGLRPGAAKMRVYDLSAKGSLETHGSGGPVQSTLWKAGDGGYRSYRIPSLLALPDGVLLAFCEARRYSVSDSGDIDLVMRRSKDGGASWSDSKVIWDDGPNTCGNPCPVFDQSNGTVVMLMTRNDGNTDEGKILKGESARTAWMMSSPDAGMTWSTPVEISSQVKRAGWGWFATGPGVSIQLTQGAHAGRLVVPCNHSTLTEPPTVSSHAVYSDDHGATWNIGGDVGTGGDECQLVELGGGALLMNMRRAQGNSATHRLVSMSMDGGDTWSPMTEDTGLPEPGCQASLIRLDPPTGEGGGKEQLLFSNPADVKERVGLTVRLSEDGGKTWAKSGVLHDGPAAYSCLTLVKPGQAACLYERGEKNPYQSIAFARFGLDWLK